MKVNWRKFLGKTGFWLVAEIGLNLLGLDNLADYSEFIFDRDLSLQQKNRKTVKVSNVPPKFCIKINEYCPSTAIFNPYLEAPSNRVLSSDRVFRQKCKKLKNPCIKVWCLSSHSVRK